MRDGSSLGARADRPGRVRRDGLDPRLRRPLPRWAAAIPPLVGLPLLFILAMGPGRSGIEGDLADRTTAALEAAGFAGATATARGRDVTVQATVADATARRAIERVAEAVDGVRTVRVEAAADVNAGGRGGLTIGLLSGVDLDVLEAGGKLVLRGEVASEELRRALVSAAADTAGAAAVLDQLQLGSALPRPQPAPDARAQAALRTLFAIFTEQAEPRTALHIGPEAIELRGTATDERARAALGDAALAAAGPGVTVRNDLATDAAPAPGARPLEGPGTASSTSAEPQPGTAAPPPAPAPTTALPTPSTAPPPPTTAPPPPTTAPLPTAPPSTAAPGPRHFVLYFASESTTPDADALAEVEAAARAAAPGTAVVVVGYADPYGDLAYNRALSLQRAQAVADAVAAANGQLAVQVGAEGAEGTVGDAGGGSRRVEVTIG